MGEDSTAKPAGTTTLGGDIYLPLYRRLSQTVAQRIAAGEWRPGGAIPSEAEFARTYDLAPGTVRKAIDTLEADGLIERRHGLGTFVRRSNFDHSMMRFFLFRDATGSPMVPESRIIGRHLTADRPEVAARLGLPPQARLIRIVRHRHWEGSPRLVEDIFLPFDRFEPILTCREDEIGPLLYPAYERLCGQLVCFIDEEITIDPATPDDARILRLPPDAPVVVIERVAFDAARRAIEWRRSRGETSRFHYRVNVS